MALLVQPADFEMATGAAEAFAFDFAADFGAGETLSNPTCELVDLGTEAAFPSGLVGTPSVAGKVVTTPTVTGLVRGHRYRLKVLVTGSGGDTVPAILHIACVA